MASLLRQIVAGPRIRHEETGLDLVYVTDRIIAMSMPAAEYPKMAYRNPVKKVVDFLDKEHGEKWAVWEFRAEGTGYDDSAFHDRVFHSPWPDHHPPPFGLIPNIMASMRNHLKKDPENVAVVHCKAGKGRTGTVTCSYLISEEGWSKEDALERFTKKRMRPQFGAGVSIPSQLRYVDYVTQWTSSKHNKKYVERTVQVEEIHLWGLREGVKLVVIGYVDEGKVMKVFHTFDKSERTLVDETTDAEKGTLNAVIFRPNTDVILPTNDICIDFEKRSKAAYGWTFVLFTTLFFFVLPILHWIVSKAKSEADADKAIRKLKVSGLAHCWFNTYFEADEQSGVFTQEWEGMDGLRGTYKKGSRIFDKMQVVWKVVQQEKEITEPAEDEPVVGTRRAEESEENRAHEERNLGLRPRHETDTDLASLKPHTVDSANISPVDSSTDLHINTDVAHNQSHPEAGNDRSATDLQTASSTSTLAPASAWTTASSSMSTVNRSTTGDPTVLSNISEGEHTDSPVKVSPGELPHTSSAPSSAVSEPERTTRHIKIGQPIKEGSDKMIS